MRIFEGNPRSISKSETENEAKNFEDSQIILVNWPMSYYSEQGHGKVSNIGGTPIKLNQRFERVEELVTKN